MNEEMYDVTAQIAPDMPVSEVENDHMYLMGIAQDCSYSMNPYSDEMRRAMENYVQSIQDSKQDDEMLVSVTEFSDDVRSSGFQNVANLSTDFYASGCTAMYDAIIVAAQQLTGYMGQLDSSGVRTRGGLVIFSDGDDNRSQYSVREARDAIEKLMQREIVVAFVAFGREAHGIAQDLGIQPQNILETNASPSELRKIWGILSKSAISSSKSAAAGASQTSFFSV